MEATSYELNDAVYSFFPKLDNTPQPRVILQVTETPDGKMDFCLVTENEFRLQKLLITEKKKIEIALEYVRNILSTAYFHGGCLYCGNRISVLEQDQDAFPHQKDCITLSAKIIEQSLMEGHFE